MQFLSEALKHIEGHHEDTKLAEAKEFLLNQLKKLPKEQYEDRAMIYYYLLRIQLKENIHLENAILQEHVEKTISNFQQQAKLYKQEIKAAKKNSTEQKVKIMQCKAYYKLLDRYLSSLETLFGAKDFTESRKKVYMEKMRYRKDHALFRKQYFNYMGYALIEVSSNYGTSFLRWGLTTIFFIALFGVILMHLDRMETGGLMVQGKEWYDYFYFSVVAFTTVGFGDITPITALQKLIVSAEVFSGYLMLGVLINLIQKKLG